MGFKLGPVESPGCRYYYLTILLCSLILREVNINYFKEFDSDSIL